MEVKDTHIDTEEDFLDALENEHIDIHSFLMIRHGKLAVEGYWTPYSPDKPYTLFSASKTFAAMGVGFAIQDGLLRTDDQVLLHGSHRSRQYL